MFALLDHTRPRLHMFEAFQPLPLNESRWNATVSHSKVSFRAHHSRLHSHTNPHSFSRQKKKKKQAVKLPFICSPCRSAPTCIMKSGARRKSPSLSLIPVYESFVWPRLLWRSGGIPNVMKWVPLVDFYGRARLGILAAQTSKSLLVEARRWSHLPRWLH